MSEIKKILLITLVVLFAASCSVISRQIKSESEPTVSLATLVQEADKYTGKTLILGGYILETKNLEDRTVIEVLQTPLTGSDEPKPKEYSEGRLLISHKGFLEPEVYRKGRKITVAGKVGECKVEKVTICKLESREIYVWRDDEVRYRSPYFYPGGYYWYGRHYHPSHPHNRRYGC